MMLIREHKELPRWITTKRLETIINRKVLVLHLLQHDIQHHNIIDRRILQQINLKPQNNNIIKTKTTEPKSQAPRITNLIEHDVGINDDDRGGLRRAEASGGGVTGRTWEGAAVNVVAQVVFPHNLRRPS